MSGTRPKLCTGYPANVKKISGRIQDTIKGRIYVQPNLVSNYMSVADPDNFAPDPDPVFKTSDLDPDPA